MQTAVDTKNHLIVTHEVTNVGSDRQQLKKMAEAAREALGTDKLTAIADRGYYNGEQIKACDDAGIVPLIPKSFTSNSRADGRYDKSDFVYIRRRDAYRCPAGEYAIRRFTSVEHGMAIYKYWSSACPRCALRSKCTTTICAPRDRRVVLPRRSPFRAPIHADAVDHAATKAERKRNSLTYSRSCPGIHTYSHMRVRLKN